MKLFLIIALAITIGPLVVFYGMYAIAWVLDMLLLPLTVTREIHRAKIVDKPLLGDVYKSRWGVVPVVIVGLAILWVLQFI
jgi:hypothetical protein